MESLRPSAQLQVRTMWHTFFFNRRAVCRRRKIPCLGKRLPNEIWIKQKDFKRAMTVISVLTFAASAACCLLSLDCVLMTDSKQWAALAAGSFSLFAALLLAVTAIWYSVDMSTRNIGYGSIGGAGRSALSTRVDIYNQRPGSFLYLNQTWPDYLGPGLIFAYIMSVAAAVVGACLIIYSNDEDCYEPDVGNGMRRVSPNIILNW